MPIPVQFSDEDLKRGELIEPGWYTVLIEKVEEGLSKDSRSTNYRMKGKIVRNGDNGDEKYAGYPIPYWNFNSKAMGFAQGYFKALLGVDKLDPSIRYDLAGGEGKMLDIFIENKEVDGAMINGVKSQYRAPRS
jgi:hypothetical protein